VGLVIFDKKYKNPEINDSKQISKKKREILYKAIVNNAIYYATKFIDADEIDKVDNIKTSVHNAMVDLIADAKKFSEALYLVDAEKIVIDNRHIETEIKGDEKYQAIAAASIIAKVEHDSYMQKLAPSYPMYHFDKNVGYGVSQHKKAIERYGIINHLHRKTFEPMKSIIKNKKK
jgi:ribonuclease HII